MLAKDQYLTHSKLLILHVLTHEPTPRKRVNEYVYLSFIKARDISTGIIIKNEEEVSPDCPSAIQLNIFL